MVAATCRVSVAAAEWHLAYLCSCGLLGVNIGSELTYAFRPLTDALRAVVEELDSLDIQRRAELLEAIRALQPARAFVAEDDPDMRDILQGALEARSFRVVAAASAKEGRARSAGDSFALAIVDLAIEGHNHGSSGAGVAEGVRDAGRDREPVRPALGDLQVADLTPFAEPDQGRADLLQEKDGGGFQGLVGGLPVPEAFGIGAAESGFQNGSQAPGFDAGPSLQIGKELAGGGQDGGGGGRPDG